MSEYHDGTEEIVRKLVKEHEGPSHLPLDVQREWLSSILINRFGDYLAAWEVRNERSWKAMSRAEALAVIERHPDALYNPGIADLLSKAPKR